MRKPSPAAIASIATCASPATAVVSSGVAP
jgi:hypothetical protein